MNMKSLKIFTVILIALAFVILLTALVYPNIEFRKNGKLYVCRFSDDFSEFEENASYNELYFYNEKRDISLKNFNSKNFLCLYLLSFDYVEGDARKTQFILEEEFIEYAYKGDTISSEDGTETITGNAKPETKIVIIYRELN